ncbi:hypothetical protein IFM89_023887 [Coptis chinensis]|uniref:C2 NT-type domain-containing protein n=1 Tax=Coptis chinensis TaxID=261450 RepID=A0A835M1I0_9MAGN|nr:hypothetical protein IFM89_023887 [Coptis chinensis]
MQKLSCLFSVEVVTIQGLPASMNGLRLSVCVRKKETKDGAVQTMPARVLQGAADFEETLFRELEFGRNYVDLSLPGSGIYGKNLEGMRVRQWDTMFPVQGRQKRNKVSTPSKTWAQADLRGIDDLNLDEPAPIHSTLSSIRSLKNLNQRSKRWTFRSLRL